MNYCYDNDFFFDEISDLINHLDITPDNVGDFSNGIEVSLTELQPLCVMDADKICECVQEDRRSESENELDMLKSVLKKYVDFDAINANMPKLYYETSETHTFAQSEILEELKNTP